MSFDPSTLTRCPTPVLDQRLLLCALLALLSGCARTASPAGASTAAATVAPTAASCAAHADELRRLAREVADKQHNIGLAVAIRQRGTTFFSEGYGFADLEDSVPVTPRTRFSVASITKAFTGVAALLAVQRGQIDLDAPIQRYVPSFPVKPGAPITPRLLAAHLSGIRHWGDERAALYSKHFDNVNDIVALFAADTLVVRPATKYSYSSPGYNLLAAALQAAEKKPYQQIVQDDLFGPLGLHDTEFDDVRAVIPYRARHYTFYELVNFKEVSSPQRVPDWDYSHNMAGGNIITTANDLVRYADAVIEGSVLDSTSRRLLETRPRLDTVESTMAFGWFISAPGAKPRRLYINGSNAGVQAGLYAYPDSHLHIAIISNTWGIGSRSGELAGSGENDLPARLAKVCQ